MTETEFQRLGALARSLQGPYAKGYLRGLRRALHGTAFGTDEEHQRFMDAEGDDSRDQLGQGYRDGFAGAEPNPPRGRPPMQEEELRTARLYFVVTQDTKARFKALADGEGLTMTQMLERWIDEADDLAQSI